MKIRLTIVLAINIYGTWTCATRKLLILYILNGTIDKALLSH